LLIKDVAAEFGTRVKVVTEDYGNSEMAKRFGVRRYPVVFVDDVLVARPKDFGFGGTEDVSKGLYVPWKEPANQARFKTDLRTMVAQRLRGEKVAGVSTEGLSSEDVADGPETLPDLTLRDINGQTVTASQLSGRVVLVEMWATWCPPCRSTMQWLRTIQEQHKDRLTVVAIAVDSKLEDVQKMMASLQPAYHVVMASPEVLEPFGPVAAVPKMFLFDGRGKRAQVFYGAPTDLHQQVDRNLQQLLSR
jgi:thiol-disulfide isomerase/thioredoxin